jgi:hypothetical protein
MEPQRIRGMHLKDLLGATRFQGIEAYVRGALDGEPQRFQQSMQKADASPTWLDIRYVPDRDGTTVRGFFVLVTDSATSDIMSHLK